MERTQAEVIARAIQQLQYQQYATKADVAALRGDLAGLQTTALEPQNANKDFGNHAAGLRADFAGFEARMTRRIYVGGAWLAAVIAAFQLFA